MAIRLTKKEKLVIEEEGTHLGDDGTYWLYFNPGWRDMDTECICLHEDTKQQVYQKLRDGLANGTIRKDS